MKPKKPAAMAGGLQSWQKGKLNQAALDTADFVCCADSKGPENTVVGHSMCSSGLKSWGISTESWLLQKVPISAKSKSKKEWYSVQIPAAMELLFKANWITLFTCSGLWMCKVQLSSTNLSRDFYLLLESSSVFLLWTPGLQTGSQFQGFSSLGVILNTGIAFTQFFSPGNNIVLNNRLHIIVNNFTISFRSSGWIPSGPGLSLIQHLLVKLPE